MKLLLVNRVNWGEGNRPYEDFTDPKARLSNIKGIVYHDGEKNITTPMRQPIQNLDALPMPARDLFYHPRRIMATAMGCPYDCEFCFSKPFWGKRVRFFSSDYVIREMIVLAEEYKVPNISICDDTFVANKPRFKKIVELVKDMGLHRKVTFNCSVRPNEVTEELAATLSRA